MVALSVLSVAISNSSLATSYRPWSSVIRSSAVGGLVAVV